MTAATSAQQEHALPDQAWARMEASLDSRGHAVLPSLLTPSDCHALVALYDDADRYRSRVVMARHGFGSGEYQYFKYPLPDLLQALRTALYPRLAHVANRWAASMKLDARYPPTLDAFLARCHAAGQTRPTPLILKYGLGDYNCLHQDLYGEHVFPLQVAMLLSRPGDDFSGGEFVVTETGSREHRAHVVPLRQGDAVVFTVHQRPVEGTRGTRGTRALRKVAMRHGVSRVRSGGRYTVGLIFHDAL